MSGKPPPSLVFGSSPSRRAPGLAPLPFVQGLEGLIAGTDWTCAHDASATGAGAFTRRGPTASGPTVARDGVEDGVGLRMVSIWFGNQEVDLDCTGLHRMLPVRVLMVGCHVVLPHFPIN